MVDDKKSNRLYDIAFALYLIVYVLVNLLFLTDFPHLNELDVSPGRPLFLLQQWIVQETGSLFFMRLPGLIGSVFVLIVLYILTVYILNFRLCGLLCAIPASLNITFITAAHQDVSLMLCLLIIMLLLLFHIISLRQLLPRHSILTGLVAGACCLISLYFILVFTGFLALYLFYTFRTKQGIRLIVDYLLAFLLSAFVFLVIKTGLFFAFPARFPFPFDQGALLSAEMLFPELLAAGNLIVYAPPSQFIAILCGVSILAGLYLVLKERNLPIRYSYTAILYLLLGFVPVFLLMRALNPLGILFLMQPSYVLLPYTIINAPRRALYPLILVVLCFSLAVSAASALPFVREPYSAYHLTLASGLQAQANDIILGPYNTQFLSPSPQSTVFYRDIPDDANTLFEMRRFVRENNVTHIIFPEEMELIHSAGPRFDSVYGSMPYYSALKQFLETDCELTGQFESSYGMNISKYYWQKKWWVKVYKITTD